jgi:hypothetical protein
MPKNARKNREYTSEDGNKAQLPKKKREIEKRTSYPTEKGRPRIARRSTSSDILDGEERHEAGLETEPKAARQRVERGHGLEYSDERGERDQHGD